MRDAEFVTYMQREAPIGPAAAVGQLGVSERTIRTYVRRANESMSGFARILLARKDGYAVAVDDAERFGVWLDQARRSDDVCPQTPSERVIYLLNDLLVRSDWITLATLCDVLYVSRSTLSADLKAVERRLAAFDLALARRPHYGIRIEGQEMARRICLANTAIEAMGEETSAPGAERGGAPGSDGAVADLLAGRPRRRVPVEQADLLATISRCVEDAARDERFQIMPDAYQSLLVHISIALLRIQEGCYAPMEPEHLERLREAREYRVAGRIAAAIERSVGVELPEEEIGYMAIHLAGKQTMLDSAGEREGIVISDDVWDAVSRMLDCVWRAFRFDFRSDLELRMNLARHIVPLAVRLRYNMKLRNPLLTDIKIRYSLAYSMAMDACTVLASIYGGTPSDDEIGYIALAFALALERQKTAAPRKSILMVCASGAGSARLLEFRCRREFGDYIDTITTCDALSLDSVDFASIDYVFTTVPIDRALPVPVREVSCFLDMDDVAGVRDMLRGGTALRGVPPFFDRGLFFAHLSATSKRETLDFLLDRACGPREVAPGFRDLVWRREDVIPTSFGNRVAMPHPLEPAVSATFICVGLLDAPIAWDGEGERVQAIFLVAFAPGPDDRLKAFLSTFTDILMSRQDIDLLIEHQSWEMFTDIVTSAFAGAAVPGASADGESERR